MLSQQEVKDNIYKSLKELGLSDNEINLYTLSLTLGPASIADYSKHLNIPRPNVYKLIESLEKHGLAKFQEQKYRKKTFMVEPPTKVTELLRTKKQNLSLIDNQLVSVMPDLLALYRQGELPSSIKVLEGREQFVKAWNESLNESNGSQEFLGSTKEFINFISWEQEQAWIEQRVKKNIFIRVLSIPSEISNILSSKDKKELRETRVLKSTKPFDTAFQLFGNKVIIWQPKAPLGILIADEYIVQMLRIIFNLLWENSK